jgi:hypothetical protein
MAAKADKADAFRGAAAAVMKDAKAAASAGASGGGGFASSGYTGKTAALLRAGYKKAAEARGHVAVAFPDGEDGTRCELNEVSYVARSALDAPWAVTRAVDAAAPDDRDLPDLTAVPRDDARAVLGAIRRHQRGIARDMVQREAGREALRRALTAAEAVPWRVEQMEATFSAERAAALDALKKKMAAFAAAHKTFADRFEADAARARRIAALQASRAAELAQFKTTA